MARKTRAEMLIPEQPNHIIIRGNNRRRLFSYPRDYRSFLRYLDRANRITHCGTNALCLMPNHGHDLKTPPSVEAGSKCVAHYSQSYATLRNANRSGSGKLFEERYYSKPIADDAHMLAAMMYIEANPIRAGIVKNAIDYPWSTYALHVGMPTRGEIPKAMWTPSPWYVSLGRTPRERAAAYRELFEDYVSRGMPDEDDRWEEISYLDEPYRRRLLRPNGSRASERFVRFRAGSK